MADVLPFVRHGSEKRQRTARPAMRCSPEELAELQAAAERAGMTVGSYMRHRCLGTPAPRAARRPPVERVALASLLGQLGKCGSNLNQIARALNSGGEPSHDIAGAIAEFKKAAASIVDVLGKSTGRDVA